jgi:hypothetical protein
MALVTLLSVVDTSEGFWVSNLIGTKISLLGTSTSLNMARLRDRGEIPGSELFPGDGPYVPYGLSAEQYSKIKKEEEDKMKKMNFAAWGPRFKRSDAPNGDWMVMPSLWTNGFNAPPRPPNGTEKPIVPTLVGETMYFLGKRFPAFLLGVILLDTLTTGFVMCRTTNLTPKQTALFLLRASSLSTGVVTAATIKAQAIKLIAAASIIPIMTRVLENTNRRRLWSTRRTIGISIGASIGSLLGLALVSWIVPIAACVLK